MQKILDEKLAKTGNIKKGQRLNPAGRPKGSLGKKVGVKDRLLGKWKAHPADKLVMLANYLTNKGDFEEAAKIWQNLLRYFEPSKRPVESAPEKSTPEESAEAAEDTFRLLQELEQHGFSKDKSGEKPSVENRTPLVPPKTGAEKDLPRDKSK